MGKQWIKMKENITTKKMLSTIHENIERAKLQYAKQEVPLMEQIKEPSFIEKANILMEEFEQNNKEFPITKNTPQFGDVYESQTSAVLKAIGESVEFGDRALVFYPETKDLVLSGKIQCLNIAFKFQYADQSGEGIYIWANGCQLTDNNLRTIGKIRDAFVNWKRGISSNADIINKLEKVAKRN